jgi:hypothetical protein
MEISKGLIRQYLDHITVGYFSDHDFPPDDMSGYDEQILSIERSAAYRGDLEVLRLGLDYLLCTSNDSLEYYTGVYGYDDSEIREIIKYVREKIYPNLPPPDPEEVKDITLSTMSMYDWWNRER